MRASSLPESQKYCVRGPKRISPVQISSLSSIVGGTWRLAAELLKQLFLLEPSEKSIHASLAPFASWSDWCPGLVSRPGLTSKTGPQVWSPGLPGFSSVHLTFTLRRFGNISEKNFTIKIACFSFESCNNTCYNPNITKHKKTHLQVCDGSVSCDVITHDNTHNDLKC